jgi:hypothetical protein
VTGVCRTGVSMRGGLPKFRNFPSEFGGSRELALEWEQRCGTRHRE